VPPCAGVLRLPPAQVRLRAQSATRTLGARTPVALLCGEVRTSCSASTPGRLPGRPLRSPAHAKPAPHVQSVMANDDRLHDPLVPRIGLFDPRRWWGALHPRRPPLTGMIRTGCRLPGCPLPRWGCGVGRVTPGSQTPLEDCSSAPRNCGADSRRLREPSGPGSGGLDDRHFQARAARRDAGPSPQASPVFKK
jgi:hypothetical protein